MEKKNLGDLVTYLGKVAKEGGNNMKLEINGQAVTDFEDYIDADHVKDKLNIITDLLPVSDENSFGVVITKAVNALHRNIREYGWELSSLHITHDDIVAMVIEEGSKLKKLYNAEDDNWE